MPKPSNGRNTIGEALVEFGTNGAGKDFRVYGGTENKYIEWLSSTDTFNVNGLLKVDGINVNTSIDYFTPEDFGAIGDGVTDDTTAIQDALDAANSATNNKKVKLGYKKTYLISYVGTRSIQTWHVGVFPRNYSLLIDSNVELDLNGSTLDCQLWNNGSDLVPINAIGNRLASNTDAGNTNIYIHNGTIDHNVEYLVYTPPLGGYAVDINCVELNNTENLRVKDLKIVNVFGYGLYVSNSRNFKLLGTIEINDVMGCALRLGWVDNTKGGYIENLVFENCTNEHESGSYVPGNTIYSQAEDIIINSIKQTLATAYIPNPFVISNKATYDTYQLGSINFANLCNNIRIGELHAEYLGVKFQNYNYSGVGGNTVTSPDNMVVGNMYLENTILSQQAKRCTIQNLYAYNCDLAQNGGNYCTIDNFHIESCPKPYTVKSSLSRALTINSVTSVDSPSVSAGNDVTNANINIGKMSIYRNSDSMADDNVSKYLADFTGGKTLSIESIDYEITQNCNERDAFLNLIDGGVVGAITGKKTTSDTSDFTVTSYTPNVITVTGESWTINEFAGEEVIVTSGESIYASSTVISNTADTITLTDDLELDGTSVFNVATIERTVDSFTITLSAGTTTTIDMRDDTLDGANRIYKNGNNMTRNYKLTALSSTSRAIDITKVQETDSGSDLTLTHSTAAGTETFFVKVSEYLENSTITW